MLAFVRPRIGRGPAWDRSCRGRHEVGERSHDEEDAARDEIRDRIDAADAVQQRLRAAVRRRPRRRHQPRCRSPQAGRPARAPSTAPRPRGAPSAMRMPTSRVRRLTEYAIDAVDADRREQQRQRAERAEHHRADPRRRDRRRRDLPRRSTSSVNTMSGSSCSSACAQHRQRGRGGLCGADDESEASRDGRRQMEVRARRFADRPHFVIAGDADDLVRLAPSSRRCRMVRPIGRRPRPRTAGHRSR